MISNDLSVSNLSFVHKMFSNVTEKFLVFQAIKMIRFAATEPMAIVHFDR